MGCAVGSYRSIEHAVAFDEATGQRKTVGGPPRYQARTSAWRSPWRRECTAPNRRLHRMGIISLGIADEPHIEEG
jgi:hypothetical protein